MKLSLRLLSRGTKDPDVHVVKKQIVGCPSIHVALNWKSHESLMRVDDALPISERYQSRLQVLWGWCSRAVSLQDMAQGNLRCGYSISDGHMV